jgi:hypothetical protein
MSLSSFAPCQPYHGTPGESFLGVPRHQLRAMAEHLGFPLQPDMPMSAAQPP